MPRVGNCPVFISGTGRQGRRRLGPLWAGNASPRHIGLSGKQKEVIFHSKRARPFYSIGRRFFGGSSIIAPCARAGVSLSIPFDNSF